LVNHLLRPRVGANVRPPKYMSRNRLYWILASSGLVGAAGTIVFFLGPLCSACTDGNKREEVAVCISDFGEPWKLITVAMRNRSVIANRKEYDLKTPQHTFTWSFVTNPDRSTAIFGPGHLIPVLAPGWENLYPNATPGKSFEVIFHQGLHVNGEIQESRGPRTLIVARGSVCPANDYGRPNPTMERTLERTRR